MFRKMRRFKQQLTDEECIEVLKETKRGVLSVLGEDGYPYGLPLNHWYNDETGKIYFHGSNAGHKIDALKVCDKVSYCAMDEGYTVGDDWALNIKSVVVFGKVKFMEDCEEVRYFLVNLCGKFTDDPNYAAGELAKDNATLLCLELTPEHISGKLVNES
ncbi:MAG: pyridoxamine 5'-phosphate oxidase family protein [Bacillota bacterium]|nr:pyridoxamine 5'-phosphate oxidase family protein [Bacillota bacterium]